MLDLMPFVTLIFITQKIQVTLRRNVILVTFTLPWRPSTMKNMKRIHIFPKIFRYWNVRHITLFLIRLLVVFFTLLVVGGCKSQDLSIRAATTDQILICTETVGYDPAKVKVAENKIAPNELKWRQCAYNVIRDYATFHPELQGMIESLVTEDIAMTTEIQQGNFTRTERRQRLDRLLDQITAAGRQNQGISQHNMEVTQQVVNGLR